VSSTQLLQLRHSAREIFDAALRGVDARAVTRRAIAVDGGRIRIGGTEIDQDKPIYVVSIGKAATSMSVALSEAIGNRIPSAVVTCQGKPTEFLPATWRQFQGGHPLPNADSIESARAAFDLLFKANNEQATVIFAVSGGGSAMMEYPIVPEISLADLQETNRLLVSCGATIAQINTVRCAFSAVKGGRLASLAPKARVLTLIISDTNRGDEASVASGPSLSPQKGNATAQIIEQYHLLSRLPKTVLQALRQPADGSESVHKNASHVVLADNGTAIQSAASRAQALGFRAVMAEDISEQRIEEGCELLFERFRSETAPSCLISGGEFSCPVQGEGQGGRNSETALRLAMAIEHERNHVLVLSAGTDGIDGNSPAAGAIADETTLSRANNAGLDAAMFLARSDSYGFFEQLGDAIFTGPTGTNVRDLRLLLKVSGS
jgi:glycerate 2-kinase